MTQKSSHPKQRKEPKNRPPAEAFEALEKLYRRVDKEISESGVECWLRGDCCDFEKVDHTLFASSLSLNTSGKNTPSPSPPITHSAPSGKMAAVSSGRGGRSAAVPIFAMETSRSSCRQSTRNTTLRSGSWRNDTTFPTVTNPLFLPFGPDVTRTELNTCLPEQTSPSSESAGEPSLEKSS